MRQECSKRRRCAIYTRKSTEDGLEQEFNSLDAQYEACAAYAVSQRHEGWVLVPDRYDDGGFSGGNMNRPGLKRMMADVASGQVDIILLYKIDRLTRSLADFAKIVEVLDKAGASFVSITQSFNTTTSMGRLTLNMLLSFAQFEREVIGERVRDKVAASRKRGLWMGGGVPTGYLVQDRKLVINDPQAELVRSIYRRYLEVRSVVELVDAGDGVDRFLDLLRDLGFDLLRTRARIGGHHRHRGGHLPRCLLRGPARPHKAGLCQLLSVKRGDLGRPVRVSRLITLAGPLRRLQLRLALRLRHPPRPSRSLHRARPRMAPGYAPGPPVSHRPPA